MTGFRGADLERENDFGACHLWWYVLFFPSRYYSLTTPSTLTPSPSPSPTFGCRLMVAHQACARLWSDPLLLPCLPHLYVSSFSTPTQAFPPARPCACHTGSGTLYSSHSVSGFAHGNAQYPATVYLHSGGRSSLPGSGMYGQSPVQMYSGQPKGQPLPLSYGCTTGREEIIFVSDNRVLNLRMAALPWQ
jgi:hypothetical protein